MTSAWCHYLIIFQTRILVTHGATYLPHVDYIYVMAEGHISEHGTFRELVDKGGDFAEFLRKFVLEQDPTSADEAEGKTCPSGHTMQ